MKSATRRCSTCRKKVPVENVLTGSLRAFCSYPCLRSFTNSDRGQKAVQSAKAKEIKERKEKVKTKSDRVKEAQCAFNRYIRLRDQNKPCISCGTSLKSEAVGGGFDAGHYRSRGSAGSLRYHLLNCYGQCKKCNRYLSGNASEFRIGLIMRIGLERVEMLESDQKRIRFTEEYLIRLKDIFNRRANLYMRKFR